MLLLDATNEFLSYFELLGTSNETVKLYRHLYNLMADYLGNPDVTKIEPNAIEAFFDYLSDEYIPARPSKSQDLLSAGSLRAYWSAIRSFWSWAVTNFDLSVRPDSDVECPQEDYAVVYPFTQREIEQLLRTAGYQGRDNLSCLTIPQLLNVCLILTLLDTGCRVSELCRMDVCDANIRTNTVFVRQFGWTARKTKGRYIHISPLTTQVLRAYLKSRTAPKGMEPLFAGAHNARMTRSSVRHFLINLGHKAGVRRCHPHKFRYTFAIQFLRNTRFQKIEELKYILGHATDKMALHYLELLNEDGRASHERGSLVATYGKSVRLNKDP